MARSRSPSGVVVSGTAKHGLDLVDREHRFGQPVLGLRQHHRGGRVEGHRASAGQPGEEALYGDEALGLGAKRQRLPVPLLVVEEVALVGVEEGRVTRAGSVTSRSARRPPAPGDGAAGLDNVPSA